MNLKKMGRYLQVNLLGLGPRFIKKEFTGPRISQRLRNTGIAHSLITILCYPISFENMAGLNTYQGAVSNKSKYITYIH